MQGHRRKELTSGSPRNTSSAKVLRDAIQHVSSRIPETTALYKPTCEDIDEIKKYIALNGTSEQREVLKDEVLQKHRASREREKLERVGRVVPLYEM